MELIEVFNKISKKGIESLDITPDIVDKVNIVMNLRKTFSDQECKNIIAGSGFTSGVYDSEVRLQYGYYTLKDFMEGYLKNIYQKDNSFEKLKKYVDLRTDSSGRDYAEKLLTSVYEYSENYELVSDIVENVQGLDESKLVQVKNKLAGLMKTKNPYEIKNYEDLQNMDRIEIDYYSSKLETVKQTVKQVEYEKKTDCVRECIREQFGYFSVLDREHLSNETNLLLGQIEDVDDYEQLKKMAIVIEKMKGPIPVDDRENSQALRNELGNGVLVPLGMVKRGDNRTTVNHLLQDCQYAAVKTENPEKTVEDKINDQMQIKLKSSAEDIKKMISGIIVQDSNIDKILQLANSRNNDMVKNSKLNGILDILNNVNETKDAEILIKMLETTISMIGTPELNQIRMDSQNIYEQLQAEYKTEYAGKLSRYEDMSPEEIAQIDGVSVRTEAGVKVVELSGAPFKCLAHSGKIDGEMPRCCTAYVSDKRTTLYMGSSNGYVFNKIDEEDIKVMSPADNGFLSREIGDAKAEQIITPESMDSTFARDDDEDYAEIQIATGIGKARRDGKEKNVLPSAMLITSKGSVEDTLSKCQEEGIGTLYVMHDEIYEQRIEEKSKEIEENLDAHVDDYLKSMNVDKLNDLLIYAGKDTEKLKMLFQKIGEKTNEMKQNKNEITADTDTLRRNISRFKELTNVRIEGKNQDGEEYKTIKGGIDSITEYIGTALQSRNKERGIDGNWLKNQITIQGKEETYDVSTLSDTYRKAGTRTEQVKKSMQEIIQTKESRENPDKGKTGQSLVE